MTGCQRRSPHLVLRHPGPNQLESLTATATRCTGTHQPRCSGRGARNDAQNYTFNSTITYERQHEHWIVNIILQQTKSEHYLCALNKKPHHVHWCPLFACKLITIGIFTRWMKNRNANTSIRMNWEFQITQELLELRYDHLVDMNISQIAKLTIWMPHLRSKSYWWWAVRIVLGEGHYGIEVASIVAKVKCWPS
jgi:Zn-finger protein